MRTKGIPLIIIVGTLIVGIVYYQVKKISFWGFTLPKSDINNAIVYTKDKSYMVTNRQIVLDLAEKISKMKRLQKIEVMRFPPGPSASPFTKIILQTKNHVTYGGSIWNLSSGNVMDSNGYYWVVTDDFVSVLQLATKDQKTTHMP